MSERADLHGTSAPATVITHGGRDYVFPHALDYGDLLAMEQVLYDRAVAALRPQQGAMDPAAYQSELAALRRRYELGEFGFDAPEVQDVLKTRKGTFLLLCHVLSATEAELLDLLAHRKDEVLVLADGMIKATFPDPPPQKPGGTPPGKSSGRRSHRKG